MKDAPPERLRECIASCEAHIRRARALPGMLKWALEQARAVEAAKDKRDYERARRLLIDAGEKFLEYAGITDMGTVEEWEASLAQFRERLVAAEKNDRIEKSAGHPSSLPL